jgi:hypothetical protein
VARARAQGKEIRSPNQAASGGLFASRAIWLLAQFAVKEFGHQVDAGSGADDEQFVERVAKAMFESEHHLFNDHVEIGALNKTKQLAIYSDDWWAAAGLNQNFERKDVEELFEKCRVAMRVVADAKMMRVGKAIFDVRRTAVTQVRR